MAWNGYSEKGQGSEERGPGTFTFTPPGVPQQQGSAPIMAKMGYQTAQSVGGLTTYNEQGDKTAAALFGFAETILKPVAQEVAARKFLEGVQRAASGEALTSIINEQPWYSRIFGPSSAVEGARQYSLDAQAAKFDAAVQARMPELRNTSPDELPAIIQKMSKDFQTGDPATDAQLGLRLTKVLPNLIQQHTREFYKAQQEHASDQRFNAWQQLATSLQATALSGGLASEDDKLLRQGNLLQALQLPEGVDPDSWKKSLGTFAASMAEAGQFHALKTVQDSGVLRNLKPEDRLQLERQITAFKRQAAREAADDYAEPLAVWRMKAANNEYASGKEVVDEANRINADYASRSGNDAPLIHRAEIGSNLMTARQAMLAYQKEVGKTVATAEDAVSMEALADQSLLTMSTSDAKRAIKEAGGKASVVDTVARKQFMALAADPRAQAAWLLKDSMDGSVVESIKDDITALNNSATDAKDANFLKGYELWKNLIELHPTRDGASNPALAAYFNRKTAAQYGAFHSALGGRSIEEAGERAFVFSRQTIIDPGYTFKKDEQKKWQEYYDESIRGNKFWGNGDTTVAGNQSAYFGAPDPLTPSSLRLLEARVQSNYKAALAAVGPDGAMAQATAMAQQDGVEIFGSYAWDVGTGRERLDSKLRFPSSGAPFTKNMIANGLNSYMKRAIRNYTDKSPDDVFITRGPDTADGDATFVFSALAGGQWLPETVFTGRELSAHIQEQLADPAKAKIMDAGPNSTYGGAYVGGYRSPRRSEATEAKIKEAQAARGKAIADKLTDRATYQFGPQITFPRSK